MIFFYLSSYCNTILFEKMKNPKLSKEEIIKSEVFIASRQLFKRYGYQKTTMEDIARAIGRGKSTLYYYYKSKDEIFEAIVLKEAEELFSIVEGNMNKVETAEAKLRTYVLTAYEVVREKAVLNDVIFNQIMQVEGVSPVSPAMKENLAKFTEKWHVIMTEVLLFGIKNKEFGDKMLPKVNQVSRVMVMTFLSTVLSFVHFSEFEKLGYNVPAELESMVDLMINGIR